MLEDKIYEQVAKNLACSYLDVSGDGRHFELIAVSDEFVGRSRVERHRMINQALGEMFVQELHALSMKLYTVNEWEQKNG